MFVFGQPSRSGPLTFSSKAPIVEESSESGVRAQTATPPAEELIADQTSKQTSKPLSNMETQRLSQRFAHLQLLGGSNIDNAGLSGNEERLNEVRIAPLFSRRVQLAVEDGEVLEGAVPADQLFPQYGLLGLRQATFRADGSQNHAVGEPKDEDMVYANINSPWSAFICGSQGGGKSHTLSCLLENSLLPSSPGLLPSPLTGIIFHYDKFTSTTSTQFCEAAYLSSKGIPVTVLVAPSNLHDMRILYDNLPGFPPDAAKPRVLPLKLQERQLNVTNMMTLMGANDSTHVPLYMGVLKQILRDMAAKNQGRRGIDYQDFVNRLEAQGFTKDQNVPLTMRLQLLNEFLERSTTAGKGKSTRQDDIWNFQKGSLTIVDLSCPFVNEKDACALFTICLGLFLEDRTMGGRVIALDEAHKFLTQSGEAEEFTGQLETIIRQQRHLGTRVLIATQEPTLKPSLLDLCDVSFVHRFRSPAWFDLLKNHLAGARPGGANKSDAGDAIFRTIIGLRTGEALVFSPTSMLDVNEIGVGDLSNRVTIQELRDAYVKVHIRQRTTADGGKSLMAVDITGPVAHVPTPETVQPTLDFSNPLHYTSSTWGSGLLAGSVAEVQNPLAQSSSTLLSPIQTRMMATANTAARPVSVPTPTFSAMETAPGHFAVTPDPARSSPGGMQSTTTPSVAPLEKRMKKSLRRNVIRLMQANHTLVDFAAIRRAAEQECGLAHGVFSQKDGSKACIQEAVASPPLTISHKVMLI